MVLLTVRVTAPDTFKDHIELAHELQALAVPETRLGGTIAPMHFDRFKRQILGSMNLDELLAKRDEVRKLFGVEESTRVSSTLPFLIAWLAVGKALNHDMGEGAVWAWLCLALGGAFLTQTRSRAPWRVWVCLWVFIAVSVMGLHQEWMSLAIAGWSSAVGMVLVAASQERRAKAVATAGKYDLLNANGGGNKNDLIGVDDLRELHGDYERRATKREADPEVPF